jgi:hypothetical protein
MVLGLLVAAPLPSQPTPGTPTSPASGGAEFGCSTFDRMVIVCAPPPDWGALGGGDGLDRTRAMPRI